MSDGMYSFVNPMRKNEFIGVLEVEQGKFHGENNFYEYHGFFSVKEGVLQGIAMVRQVSALIPVGENPAYVKASHPRRMMLYV